MIYCEWYLLFFDNLYLALWQNHISKSKNIKFSMNNIFVLNSFFNS